VFSSGSPPQTAPETASARLGRGMGGGISFLGVSSLTADGRGAMRTRATRMGRGASHRCGHGYRHTWNLWQAAAGASIASDRTSASLRLFKVMPERTNLPHSAHQVARRALRATVTRGELLFPHETEQEAIRERSWPLRAQGTPLRGIRLRHPLRNEKRIALLRMERQMTSAAMHPIGDDKRRLLE